MQFDKLGAVLENSIDRLNSIDIHENGASKEIDRGRTIARLAKSSIDNAAIVLDIEKFKADHNKKNSELPKVLQTEEL